MKCWIERMCKAAEEEGGEAEVMLCADTCLQNQLKNRGPSRIQKWCGEREDCFLTLFFFYNCGDRCAYTVASRLLFQCVCVWKACLVSLHWEAAVGCITSDFLFHLAGLAVFSTLPPLSTWALSLFSWCCLELNGTSTSTVFKGVLLCFFAFWILVCVYVWA